MEKGFVIIVGTGGSLHHYFFHDLAEAQQKYEKKYSKCKYARLYEAMIDFDHQTCDTVKVIAGTW